METTDILIVGAGPTGLTLANILGRSGINTVIIDRKESTVAEPRAVSIDDESLRTMQAIGLAPDVLRDVVAGYGVHYYTKPGGRCFGKVEPTVSDYGFPRRNAFRQPLFEATLRNGLERFSCVSIRFNHNLESFDDTADGVNATISKGDGTTITISARYLIACDGGRSPVREMLRIPMSGTTFKSRWIVIDTDNDDDPFWQTRVYCDARRPIVEVPGPHKTRRFEILIHPDEDAEAMMKPEKIREFLRPFRGEKSTSIVRQVVYTFHARMAERWRHGRVFLAGDAAHLTPPYAGQGMNSGVRDAHNLGWKLAQVIKGKLPDAALESYEAERRDHAWSLIRLALHLGEVMAPRTPLHAWAISTFFTLAAYVPPVRDYFLQMRFKPKPRYTQGLLISTTSASPADLRGTMLPQPSVTQADGSETRIDDLIGDGFALVAYGTDMLDRVGKLSHPLWKHLDSKRLVILPAGSSIPESASNDPELIVCVDHKNEAAKVFDRIDRRVVLLRPDRYVAGTFATGGEQEFAYDYAAQLGLSTLATVTYKNSSILEHQTLGV
jgi:3-(3-hydroxy-phenyl)propionate hydroxylase